MDMKEEYAALAARFRTLPTAEVATALDETDKELDEVSKYKSRLEVEKEFLKVFLAERLTEEGMKAISLSSGARFRVQDEMFVSATAEHKPEVIRVLKDTGNGGIIKEDFNAMTFKSLVKQLKPSEDGMPHPTLQQLMEAGMKLRVVAMARRY